MLASNAVLLTPSVSLRLFRLPSYKQDEHPAPILRTLFQVPYPVNPLLATLTKTAGVGTNNSHSGSTPRRTRHGPLSTHQGIQVVSFHTLAHSFARRKKQLSSFQSFPHSLPKNTRVGVPLSAIIPPRILGGSLAALRPSLT